MSAMVGVDGGGGWWKRFIGLEIHAKWWFKTSFFGRQAMYFHT